MAHLDSSLIVVEYVLIGQQGRGTADFSSDGSCKSHAVSPGLSIAASYGQLWEYLTFSTIRHRSYHNIPRGTILYPLTDRWFPSCSLMTSTLSQGVPIKYGTTRYQRKGTVRNGRIHYLYCSVE